MEKKDVQKKQKLSVGEKKLLFAICFGAGKRFYTITNKEGKMQFFLKLLRSFNPFGIFERVACLLRQNEDLEYHVEALEEILRDLLVQNITDFLTGAFNKQYLNENLKNIFEAHERGKNSFAIIAIDLDRFKEVNDNDGHAMGDLVLATVVRVFFETVRKTDIVIRAGGDEFFIILTNLMSDTHLQVISQKLHKGVDAMVVGDCTVKVTLSMGVLYIEPDEKGRIEISTTDALSAVDALLYKSKNTGRNKTTFGSLISRREVS